MDDDKSMRHDLEECVIDDIKLRLARVENLADEYDSDKSDSKADVMSQVSGIQTELALLTRQIGDRLPHLAFAQDLDEARQHYSRFSSLSERMVVEFARVKEQVEKSESLMKKSLEEQSTQAISDKGGIEMQMQQADLRCSDLFDTVNQTIDGHVTELNLSVAKNWASLETSIHEMTTRISESEAHLKETLEKVSLELYDKIVVSGVCTFLFVAFLLACLRAPIS